MSAALLWAESECWLSHDTPACPAWRMLTESIHPERFQFGSAVRADHLLDQHKLAQPVLNEAGAIIDGIGPCPARLNPGRGRSSRIALILSIVLHAALVLGAVAWTSQGETLAERGGTPDHVDVLVIGAEEADALLEGAKPQPASLVPEPMTVPTPIVEPTGLMIPAPDLPTTPVFPDPEPVLPMPIHPVEPPTQKTVEAPSSPVKPVIRQQKRPERTIEPVQIRPPQARTARVRPEARGQVGEGTAMVNRQASSRGGTGGRAAVAGSAAMTSFRSRLVAHLTRYKNYPEQAQERGIGGRNAVTITLSREGRVISTALTSASGHSILDQATMAAVRRAQPFPTIPEDGPTTFSVTIGLNYALR